MGFTSVLHEQQLIAQLSQIKPPLPFSPPHIPHHQPLRKPTLPLPITSNHQKCHAEHKAPWKEIVESMNDAAGTRDLGSDGLYTEDSVLTYYITYILPRCVSRLPVAAAAEG
jgi:hypothetical protein